MGRLKELRLKAKDGSITDDEKKELEELEADVNESVQDEGDEAKAIEELSSKLAEKTMSKITASLEKQIVKESKPEVVKTEKMVFDASEGRDISVKDLSEQKFVIDSRKNAGKKHFEVSKKTMMFVQALVQNDRQKLQLLVEGTAGMGGYLVADEFANMIVEDRNDLTVMRQLATVIPVGSDTFHLPNLETRPKAFWRSETAAKTTTTATFDEVTLTPYSLAAIAGLSNELVADANIGPEIISLIAGYLAKAIGVAEDKAFWTGNGTGQPTGIDNYTFTTIAVAAGGTDAQRADALITALYKLGQGYRNGAAYVMNKNTLARVATLKDSNGQYLLTGLGSDPAPRIRGRLVYEQNDIGDGKCFVGDFSEYYIADRQGITVDISKEATVASTSAFEKNLTWVRVEERVDGELPMTNGVIEVTGLGGV